MVSQALCLTVRLLEGLLNVESLVLGEGSSVDVVSTVELGNSFGGALGSVLAIGLVLGVVADKGEGALGVSHELHALNATELLEKLSDIRLLEAFGEVLGVDVVEDFAEVTLVTRLVLDDLAVVGVGVGIEGRACAAWVLEADESVATRLMIGVEGDLEGLDVTILDEVLLKELWGHLLGDLTHEDVVVHDLLWVRAKKVVVEGEATGWLSVGKLKVTQLLAGLDELVLLGDRHDSGVEGAVEITSDLGHTA